MTAEEWRPVVGFADYSVSDRGRVTSHRLRIPRLMSPAPNSRDYLTVTLRDAGGRPVTRTVHSLVAEAFIGPRPAGEEVRHLDGDKENCALANLAHGTRGQNQRDSVIHGTHRQARKSECDHGHPFDEANTLMWQGKRKCRACAAAHSRAYRQRQMFRAAGDVA